MSHSPCQKKGIVSLRATETRIKGCCLELPKGRSRGETDMRARKLARGAKFLEEEISKLDYGYNDKMPTRSQTLIPSPWISVTRNEPKPC